MSAIAPPTEEDGGKGERGEEGVGEEASEGGMWHTLAVVAFQGH